MVREGYGTSGEGNGTVVGHPKMGAGEVLPLLARDPNYSSVPGSDAEPRLSDAGSGNDGPKKAARGRASVHGEVLLANKTLKKKPYKSLGWSLIAVRPSEPAPFSWLFLGLDVTARTQNPGFKPPDRMKHPPFFCRTPRCRARAAARTPRASASPDEQAGSRATFPPRAASPDPASDPTPAVPPTHPPPPRLLAFRLLLHRV